MVTATNSSVAALPDLASYVSALAAVVSAWGALPANKSSVLDAATQAITDLNSQATQAPPRPFTLDPDTETPLCEGTASSVDAHLVRPRESNFQHTVNTAFSPALSRDVAWLTACMSGFPRTTA